MSLANVQTRLNMFIDNQIIQNSKEILENRTPMRTTPSQENYERHYRMNAWNILKRTMHDYMEVLENEEDLPQIFAQLKCLLSVMSEPKNYDPRYISNEERFLQVQQQPYLKDALNLLEKEAIQQHFLPCITKVTRDEVKQFTEDYMPLFVEQQRMSYRLKKAVHVDATTKEVSRNEAKRLKKRHKKERAKLSDLNV